MRKGIKGENRRGSEVKRERELCERHKPGVEDKSYGTFNCEKGSIWMQIVPASTPLY